MTWALYFHKSNNTKDRDTVVNPNNPILTKVLRRGPRIHVLLLRFQIPPEYQNKYNYATIQTVLTDDEKAEYRPLDKNEPLYNSSYYNESTEIQWEIPFTKVFMRHRSNVNDNDLSYRNVPFCQILDKYSFYINPPKSNLTALDPIFYSPNGQKKDFLRLCTKNIIYDKIEKIEMLMRWMFYHLEQGFSPPTVYVNRVNGSKEKAFSNLNNAVKQNLINLVDFRFPYAFSLHDNPIQEHSCIWRNKGRTVWLGLNDVDERFFARERTDEFQNLSKLTIAEILTEKFTNIDFFSKYGGVICPNNWMIRYENESTYYDSVANAEFRQKLLLIPDNVNFIKTHIITNGKSHFPVPNDLIVNGHFKNFNTESMEIESLIYTEKMTEINKRLTKKIKNLMYDE